MRRITSVFAGGIIAVCLGIYLYPGKTVHYSSNGLSVTTETARLDADNETEEEENENGYSEPWARDLLEAEKTQDPALGTVPTERLGDALSFAEEQKANFANRRTAMKVTSYISWEERGPIGDIVGPSNGNNRGGVKNVHKTSGRVRAVLFDEANDPTGNTLFAAGVAGGLWKCTNFLNPSPNWQPLTDKLSNLAISSICQDPSNPSIMYFSTGEATNNADAVYGNGVWKSTDAGATWKQLPASSLMRRNFKVVCDNAGNLYVATRALTAPVEQPYGLYRSKDGGASFQNINPTNLTCNNVCTDIEISSTGRMHASFGYYTTNAVTVNHVFTDDPANVTPTGWTRSTGIRLSTVAACRMEMATSGDTVYAITINQAYNVDSCYRSVNGGVTFTKRNTTILPSGIGSGQGWYNVILGISPNNPEQIIMGGLDAYRSTNGGQTASIISNWVNGAVGTYVHADQHFIRWWNADGQTRVLIGSDGGLFLSVDNGVNWTDRNQNLGIKQFYSGAIHPAAGSNYLLAGAQDNGTHAISTDGLSNSVEVTGGDGAFVHIDQVNPNNQMGAYVYNQYRRSANGGATWSSANFSSSFGLFINPFTMDDATNTLWACYGVSSAPNNAVKRWPSANTLGTSQNITISELSRNGAASNGTAFKVSPYTANRIFIGGSTGRLIRLDNCNAVSIADIEVTSIGSSSFPTGFMNCVNVGSSDQHLVAVFTNYGVNNLWVSHNAGEDWEAVDGNLPDMPVRWAMFHPQFDNRLIIATEAGIYTTDALNGDKTKWTISPNFPTVRTDMIQMRKSDNMLVAGTHGRGLWTGQLQVSTNPEVNFVTDATHTMEQTIATEGCRGYKDYSVDMSILNAPAQAVAAQLMVASGNAVKGVDFDFTTSGSFATPSTVVNFPAGVKENKTIIIRIYDDAEVETAESFKIGFTVSGDPDAEAGAVDTHEVFIGDNDHAPVATPTVLPFGVGEYTTWVGASSPFAANRVKQRQQSLFTAAELKAAGIYKAGAIKNMTIRVAEKNSTQPYVGLTISMANVPNTTLSAGFVAGASYQQVFSGDYATVAGNNTFVFNTPFEWDGVSNVVVNICFDNGTGSAVSQYPDYLEGNAYPLGATIRASTYANFVAQTVSGCELSAAFVTDYRYNAVFGADLGINPIASALNTAKTEYLNISNDLYYYSATGEIIARVHNMSATNFGCTDVKISRAGTSAAAFWNNNKKNYLTDKAYFIAGGAGAGKYEVTFYFTAAEKAGWEAATGESWSNIQLVHTSGRIADVTPANAKPNNNGTVLEVINATHGTYGSGYTLSAVFEGGFGGFAAGLPGRLFNVIAKASVATEQQVTVANNPFSDQINLVFATPIANNTTAVLYDMQGKPMQKSNIAKGATRATIRVSNAVSMSRGFYIVTVTDNGKLYQVKLMKQ